MPPEPPEKLKHTVEHIERKLDEKDAEFEQTVEKVEPYLHEARQRLAEAEIHKDRPSSHAR